MSDPKYADITKHGRRDRLTPKQRADLVIAALAEARSLEEQTAIIEAAIKDAEEDAFRSQLFVLALEPLPRGSGRALGSRLVVGQPRTTRATIIPPPCVGLAKARGHRPSRGAAR